MVRALLSGVALAIAAPAQAQAPDCARYQQYTQLLQTGLAPLRGAQQADNVWLAAENLPGYELCLVAVGSAGAQSYLCRAQLRAGDTGRARYEAAVAEMRACLADWSETTVTEGDKRADVVSGVRFWRRSGERGATMGISLLRDRATGRLRLVFAIADALPDDLRARQ